MDEEREKQIQEMTDKIFNEMKEKEASQAPEQTPEQAPEQVPEQPAEGYFKSLFRQAFSVRNLSMSAILLNVISIATGLWQYRDFTLPIRACGDHPSCGAGGGWVFFLIIFPFVLCPCIGGLAATALTIIRAFVKLSKGEKLSALEITLLIICAITAIAAFVIVRMMMTF